MGRILGIALICVFTFTAGMVMAENDKTIRIKDQVAEDKENKDKDKDKDKDDRKDHRPGDKDRDDRKGHRPGDKDRDDRRDHRPGDKDRDDHKGRPGDRDRDDRKGHRPGDRDHRDRRDQHNRQEARRILIDTNNILEQAQREAERGGYYEGLGRAFSHQREAKDLYNNNRSYDLAINHSLRAREIAKDIIQINRDIQRDRHRKPPKRDYDKHDDLDNSISVKIIDNHAALKLKFKID